MSEPFYGSLDYLPNHTFHSIIFTCMFPSHVILHLLFIRIYCYMIFRSFGNGKSHRFCSMFFIGVCARQISSFIYIFPVGWQTTFILLLTFVFLLCLLLELQFNWFLFLLYIVYYFFNINGWYLVLVIYFP